MACSVIFHQDVYCWIPKKGPKCGMEGVYDTGGPLHALPIGFLLIGFLGSYTSLEVVINLCALTGHALHV